MAEFTRSEAKAWAKERVRDFYAAPITPLTADFQLDEAGIRENVEAYIDWGVDGLVIGGFANETWNMRPEWWYRLHEITADAVRGRTDLWTIILDPCAEVCIDKLKHVEKLGFSGAELMNPMTQLRGDDEIYNFFKYVTDRSDLGICLYRTPVSGKVMGLDLLKRLVDIPTVVCTKQGNLNRAESLLLRASCATTSSCPTRPSTSTSTTCARAARYCSPSSRTSSTAASARCCARMSTRRAPATSRVPTRIGRACADLAPVRGRVHGTRSSARRPTPR